VRLIKVFDPITLHIRCRLGVAVDICECSSVIGVNFKSILKADRNLPVSALEVHTSEFYKCKKIICPLHDVDCCTDGALAVLCCFIEPP